MFELKRNAILILENISMLLLKTSLQDTSSLKATFCHLKHLIFCDKSIRINHPLPVRCNLCLKCTQILILPIMQTAPTLKHINIFGKPILYIRDAPLNCNDIVNYFIAICQGDHSITKCLLCLLRIINCGFCIL